MTAGIVSAVLLSIVAIVIWLRKGYLLSPFVSGIGGFLLTCAFNVHPMLSFEAATPRQIAPDTLIIVNLTALLYIIFGALVPRNRHDLRFTMVTFPFRPSVMICLCSVICLVAVGAEVKTYGTLPVLASARDFGTEYYDLNAKTGAVTFMGLAAGTIAFTIFALEACSAEMPTMAYIRKRKIVTSIVVFCALCNLSSGFRYTIIGKIVIFGTIYELTRRLRPASMIAGVFLVTAFFISFGNYRFNQVRVEDKLGAHHQFGIASNSVAWLATYSEPILQNFDNFISVAPPPLHGGLLLSTIVPSFLHSYVGLERYSSATYLEDRNMYAHHGLTFRTFYPEFMMDFGIVGGTMVGMGVVAVCFLLLHQTWSNPQYLLPLVLAGPSLFGVALLNEFVKLYTLVPLILCLCLRIYKKQGIARYGTPLAQGDAIAPLTRNR